ncbi:MAG: peptide chain release factor N(5)-glutamine methyltransferase [Aquificaceae bacterium]|nr:peptide chain release factor N(5)-glutamine methyltransferase [Aquificaceae bacterium]
MRVKDLLSKPSRISLRDKILLLAHLLKVNHKELYLMEECEVSHEVRTEFLDKLNKLEEGYPLQYLIGEWDFYGNTFYVEEGVLIPRPETEILVEEVLKRLPLEEPMLGFELGVGTGCISISLLLCRESLKMLASDINLKALKLARRNSKRHGVSERLMLVGSDLFEAIKPKAFDFVVSNPPYIPMSEWESLSKGVRLEGYNSLIAGMEGWEFYVRIGRDLEKYLKGNGFFAFEIGHDQGRVVRGIFESLGYKVEVIKDYAGQDRVVVGWRY